MRTFDRHSGKRASPALIAPTILTVFVTTFLMNLAIPVALVENSGRCNKNEHDEKILPTGIPWIPNIVSTIMDIALNGKGSILVDQKLIEGPNANNRGKLFIPLILAFQYFFIINPIRNQIKNDIARASYE